MFDQTVGGLRRKLWAGVSALAISCLSVTAVGTVTWSITVDTAIAQHSDSEHESGGGRRGSGGGGHSDGGHDSGTDDAHSDEHDDAHGGGRGGHNTEDGGGAGQGSGGHGGNAGGEGQGPRLGQQTDRTRGMPPWAREGIPEIELGRLNAARSPSHVLDRAYNEALASFTQDKVVFYNMSLEEAAAALRTNFGNVAMIDSPIQNLALLRDIFEDGQSVLNTLDQVENNNGTLAAIFLGTASDKGIRIQPETAYAIGVILGYAMSEAQATALARDAEIIRAAIAQGHG